MKHFLIIISLILITIVSYSQEQNPRTQTATDHLSKWDKKFGEVKYKDKVYRQGSNWFDFGLGYAYNIDKKSFDNTFTMAYHYRYKGVYFNGGFHYTTQQLFDIKPLRVLRPMEFLLDIYLGAGLRTEGRWHHIGFFIGPSFATTLISRPDDSKISDLKFQLGAYVKTEIIFKLFYDLGLGVSVFGSFNKRYQVAGLQITFYFSNAFITKY